MAPTAPAVALLLILVGASPLRAQSGVVILPEARLDVLAARSTAAQLGLAWSAGSTGYNRVVLGAAAGVAERAGRSKASGRIDASMRFLLDPQRVSRWGIYGYGGLSALYDGFDDWRAVVHLGLGLEFPSRRESEWAAELGLGGGVRVGLALRRLRPEHR